MYYIPQFFHPSYYYIKVEYKHTQNVPHMVYQGSNQVGLNVLIVGRVKMLLMISLSYLQSTANPRGTIWLAHYQHCSLPKVELQQNDAA